MAAFFPGILAARWGLQKASTAKRSNPAIAVLAIQRALLLFTAAGINRLPTFVVTACIALYQRCKTLHFEPSGAISNTSVVSTGNLRSLGEARFDRLGADQCARRDEIRTLAAIRLSFAAGSGHGSACYPYAA